MEKIFEDISKGLKHSPWNSKAFEDFEIPAWLEKSDLSDRKFDLKNKNYEIKASKKNKILIYLDGS